MFGGLGAGFGGKYILISHVPAGTPNIYKRALVLYEEVESPGAYAYAAVPVAVEVPEPVAQYSFSFSGVYETLTNYGNIIVQGMQIDPQTGQVLVTVVACGVLCVMTLAMAFAVA